MTDPSGHIDGDLAFAGQQLPNTAEGSGKERMGTMHDELHDEGGSEAERFWEGHYRVRERVWSGRPNPVLVDVVGPLAPGAALDLGCGEGGDAVWLAGRDWRVTAVDVSAIALERASALAAEAGVEDRIDFQRHDLPLTFPVGAFDLISAQYLHSPVELPRDRILQAAADALAPDGLLLIVDHGSVRPWGWKRHSHRPRFSTPEEVLEGLDLDPGRWRAEILDSPERQSTGPDGQKATVTDNVIALRRLAR